MKYPVRAMAATVTYPSDNFSELPAVLVATLLAAALVAPVFAPVALGVTLVAPVLVAAALAAQGETVITGLHYIDRGYERLEDTLTELGAEITRRERQRTFL